ncbi:hypothetical protein [Thiogranum longum]|uniref:hypothetical protein n=1 Tax=Thiogranum longum TaxID=1537524 RepID=UPI00104FEA14|nr:hypothetical protein [Thiogranum longum]
MPNKVLEEVTIQVVDGKPVLEAKLSFLFSYLGHFPIDEGKELRIRLKPVQVAPVDRESVSGREGISPQGAEQYSVDEVVYEGDVKEGPWLTIHFTRPVHYHVIPGPDYRSIKVFLDPSDQ